LRGFGFLVGAPQEVIFNKVDVATLVCSTTTKEEGAIGINFLMDRCLRKRGGKTACSS
jgi:hypothetical protein